jgi:hypothetical protein
MPAPTTRRRWAIAAPAVATVALVAAAILARTGGDPDHPAGPAQRSETGATRPGPDPAVPRGAAPARRDAAGAAAVAVRVATASQRWLYLTDEQVAAEVTALATPAAGPVLAEDTVAEIRAARDQLGASPGRVWWLVRPMATQVEHADADAARVSVWVVTVLSAAEVAAPQSEWMIVTVDLEWTPEGWRVDAVREDPGPTPMTGPHDDPWDAIPFDDVLAGFVRLDGDPVEPAQVP